MGRTLSDNWHGLLASAMITLADGHAEREAAKTMICDARQVVDDDRKITLGAETGYDARKFIEALEEIVGEIEWMLQVQQSGNKPRPENRPAWPRLKRLGSDAVNGCPVDHVR